MESEQATEEGTAELDRRKFLGKAGLGVAGFAASASILAACSSDDDATADAGGDDDAGSTDEENDIIEASQDAPEIVWDMATSWPTALVTIFGGATYFTEQVSRLTGGKFQITARPAGEIVGGLEVLPAVRDGGAQSGHTASYYYTGLSPVQQFGTAVPFGLTQRQQNAWLYQGYNGNPRGIDILNEFYASEHGTISFPAGGTGCQMGGWFSKEIETVGDLNGLKMRIPGMAGQVLTNLGGEQVSIPGGEILQSIQTGVVDAAEFVGPTDDLILGLDQIEGDLFYYHPGWWEPGTALEVQFPLSAWNELPEQYQAAIEAAAALANNNMMATYDTLNPLDLQTIKGFAEIREFNADIMGAFKTETENVLDGFAADNGQFADILGPWREFRGAVSEWHGLAEKSYLNQQTEV
ncbi:MAG: ABC transporter substrate-binding protein [Acidimicrobiales bacterium]|nr:ABC transporter substrate-binding protein [Acidimicrobiia bacterium]NNC81766.1 ABC transporter substrate-binding protein [Acidimicrobiales bacterium]RZV43168.1 MAG: ABC transporter substrate-binding protein [Acidimicrobiales bacterium]